MADLILGQVLSFAGNPFHDGPAAARHETHGAVLVQDGLIADVGPADTLRARHPTARIHDHGRALISAGFIDAHVHYPQTAIIASWGKRLIDWLNQYTFPEEMRFADPAYATVIAGRYLDLALAHGTTSMCSYATILGLMLYDETVVNSPPLLIMLGSLGTAWTGCISYWFGTTQGSLTKTNLLAQSVPK